MQKPQLFQMFPIILEHWTEVDQGILVHMWLDPVGHLIFNVNLKEKHFPVKSFIQLSGNLCVQGF